MLAFAAAGGELRDVRFELHMRLSLPDDEP
jgi:hypothetical protein